MPLSTPFPPAGGEGGGALRAVSLRASLAPALARRVNRSRYGRETRAPGNRSAIGRATRDQLDTPVTDMTVKSV
jgi:hypothetical protein